MPEIFQTNPETVLLPDVGALPELMGARRPIHVEVGFGKDVRVLREAARMPDELFLGIEISGKKARSLCRKAVRAGLANVRAYRGDVRPVLAERLPPGSVASFTALFPDPWPKWNQQKHRWIREATARQMRVALMPGGMVTLATDHDHYRDQMKVVMAGAGFELLEERPGVPDDDRTLFAQRFERLGESVTWLRWRSPETKDLAPGGGAGATTSSV